MRILILDDNEPLAGVLALNLRVQGFSVAAFTSPSEALKIIDDYDVLVTDYDMPEMTGLEVARQAYAKGWKGSLLIMSGRAAALSKFTQHPLLQKPFSIQELIDRLPGMQGPGSG
jgi:DNA-binding response OmpR family regulator